MTSRIRPRIGMLWGDFSQAVAPSKLGKLWSMGRVAHTINSALQGCGQVVPFYGIPTGSNFSFDASSTASLEALAAFLQDIDILWADLYPASTQALTLRKELKLSCPAILFAGGTLPKGAEAMLFPWQHLLRSNDGILFSSRADQNIWKRLVTWSMLQEWVVPLSIDEQIFYPRSSEERQESRTRYGHSSQTPLLLYVGRLNIQKNLHTLLYLLKEVHRQVPEVYLYLVGEEDDIVLGEFAVRNTGYVAWLKRLADEMGIADWIKFPGPLFGEDLARMYAAADVVVNFSVYHRENFGLSQAEATACGVPIVCTAWGGFKEVVQNGVTGYFVDTVLTKHGIRVNWVQGIHKIVTLLQQRTLREEMGRQAALYAREHFSIFALNRHLASVINDVQHTDGPISNPAYQPSLFAESYEAHKRTCGWYAAKDDECSWYPSMFQGEAYALYETLMQPYATLLAQEIDQKAIKHTWIPYFPSAVAFDTIRLYLSNKDPIWPHQRFFTPMEWKIVDRINGHRTIHEIANETQTDLEITFKILWGLYLEGFILFADQTIETLAHHG